MIVSDVLFSFAATPLTPSSLYTHLGEKDTRWADDAFNRAGYLYVCIAAAVLCEKAHHQMLGV